MHRLTGQVFGRLAAIEQNGHKSDGRVTWLCRCECGKEHTAAARELVRGRVRSCGCMRADINAERTATAMDRYVGQHMGLLEILGVVPGRRRSDGKSQTFLRVKCHGCDREFDRQVGAILEHSACGACAKMTDISIAARDLGTSTQTIYARIKRGWSRDAALSIPPGGKRE